MSKLAVANQYAKALLESISKAKVEVRAEVALAQLEAFEEVLEESPELRSILRSPAVSHEEKQKVIGRIGSLLGVHGYVKNFLYIVTRHRRLGILGEIKARFQALLDEREGLVRAHVASPYPLSAAQKSAIESELAKVTGQEVRCGYGTDESLIGGVAVRVGSKVFDGSLRGQMESLQRRLADEP
jgi:F-type H+-transporting ATPase subunit delta